MPVHSKHAYEEDTSATERSVRQKVPAGLRATLLWDTLNVTDVTFSSDGQKVVTTSFDKTARVWDIATAKCLHTLVGHTEAVLSAEFSPDNRYIVTASRDQTIRIWNVATGEHVSSAWCHTDAVVSAEFSPDGRQILTVGRNKMVCEWLFEEERANVKLKQRFCTDGMIVARSIAGALNIVTAGDDDTASVCVMRLTQNGIGCINTVYQLKGHTSSVRTMKFSPEGLMVVTAGDDNTTRLWDTYTGRCISIMEEHGDSVTMATFSDDGCLLLTTSEDNTAIVWDVMTGKAVHTLQAHWDTVNFGMFSPDGRYIATASADNTARLWDAATGECLQTLEHDDTGVYTAEFSPDGLHMVTVDRDNTARIWKLEGGTKVTGAIAAASGEPAAKKEAASGCSDSPYTCAGDRVTMSSLIDLIMRDLGMQRIEGEPIADAVKRIESACGVCCEGTMRMKMEKMAVELGLNL